MRTLEAARVTLEPQIAAHAAEMFGVLSDPAIYAYENQPPASLDELRERFAKLESRRSPDGNELWLNWVVRFRPAPLIGYVQATVLQDARAWVAYEFASAWWGRGLAHEAVQAMIGELIERYGVVTLIAVAQGANQRSLRLLERLAFTPAAAQMRARHELEPGEVLFWRDVSQRQHREAAP